MDEIVGLWSRRSNTSIRIAEDVRPMVKVASNVSIALAVVSSRKLTD